MKTHQAMMPMAKSACLLRARTSSACWGVSVNGACAFWRNIAAAGGVGDDSGGFASVFGSGCGFAAVGGEDGAIKNGRIKCKMLLRLEIN